MTSSVLFATHAAHRTLLATGAVAWLGVASAAYAQPNPGPPSPTLASCAVAVNATHPARPAGPVPPDRLKVLAKGVNLTDALRPGDIAVLLNAGIRHIRIPINPEPVIAWSSTGVPDTALQLLDSTVCQATSAGIAVILDMHPEGRLALTDDAPPDLDSFMTAWDRLATRYAIFTPDLIVFELMNEPGLSDGTAWAPIQETLLAHIRSAASQHTVLLTASPDSTAGALAALDPLPDPNVGYVFHFYSPPWFTLQGANWASDELGSIRGLIYPADPGNVDDVLSQASSSVAQPLTDYLAEYSDATALQSEVNAAAQWARSNKTFLVATEFGVYTGAVPAASRAAWLSDVHRALEAQSIGWTVWEYRGRLRHRWRPQPSLRGAGDGSQRAGPVHKIGCEANALPTRA